MKGNSYTFIDDCKNPLPDRLTQEDIFNLPRRHNPITHEVILITQEVVAEIEPGVTFQFYTYNSTVPGPAYFSFIMCAINSNGFFTSITRKSKNQVWREKNGCRNHYFIQWLYFYPGNFLVGQQYKRYFFLKNRFNLRQPVWDFLGNKPDTKTRIFIYNKYKCQKELKTVHTLAQYDKNKIKMDWQNNIECNTYANEICAFLNKKIRDDSKLFT
eukprot:UN29428